MVDATERHIPLKLIESYLEKRIDGVFALDGNPPAQLVVWPGHHRLGVRVPAVNPMPDVTGFENLRVEEIAEDGSEWHELSVRFDESLEEVYGVLCNILDRVQLAGETFANSVDGVLGSLAEILAIRRGLSQEQEVGLAGELMTLMALAETVGCAAALATWRGPMGEEHDFGLSGEDVEVKVTLNEKRLHWISSVTQLTPMASRPLFLLSIQLTRAGAGAGRALPSLIGIARGLSGMPLAAFESTIALTGFREADSDLYQTQWALRSIPQFFHVDERFPAITNEGLEGIPARQHIVDVRYRLDLTGLPVSPQQFPFQA